MHVSHVLQKANVERRGQHLAEFRRIHTFLVTPELYEATDFFELAELRGVQIHEFHDTSPLQ